MCVKDLIYGFNDAFSIIYYYENDSELNHKLIVKNKNLINEFIENYGERKIIDWSYTHSNNALYLEI